MTHRLYLVLAAVLLVCASATEEDEEEAVLEALKVCSEEFKPTDDDLTEISKGELKSDVSKAVITCWFKGAGVMMQDKMFHTDKAVTFLRALTPGNPNNDNVAVMKKLSEKCAAIVNSEAKNKKTDEDAAVIIYDCMVREGRSMRMTLEEGNGKKSSEGGAVKAPQ